MSHRAKPPKIVFSPEQRALHRAIQERSKQERSGPDELLANGDIEELVPNWQAWELFALVAKLKKERERRGLSLNGVSAESGLTKAQISELENRHRLNPTLKTLYCYALAVGFHIKLVAEELPREEHKTNEAPLPSSRRRGLRAKAERPKSKGK